jgi:hypothetical protein
VHLLPCFCHQIVLVAEAMLGKGRHPLTV